MLRTWGKPNMTSESKTLDKTRPHSTRVKNKHEECQCLWGRERRLKIYIYSESVRDQTAKLIHSSFKPCAAAFPQFPHLNMYRLSTSAIAMKTPGWPAVTSPRARVPATRREGLVWLPWAKMWDQFTHDPFLLAHKKQTCQLDLFVLRESNQNDEQPLFLNYFKLDLTITGEPSIYSLSIDMFYKIFKARMSIKYSVLWGRGKFRIGNKGFFKLSNKTNYFI